MHIYFSGIGGAGIGPLALVAHQAGYTVSGSDKQQSSYIDYLKKQGITNISVGQTTDNILGVNSRTPIDWFVYSSALPKENPNHPELTFVQQNGIKQSKRDEFLNYLLTEKNLKLFAVAGTHGKTTTTAMAIWLFKQLGIPISYSVGAKLGFGEMGQYKPDSEYFVYECDEYDRNFLSFKPELSVITGIDWDHADVYPTRQDYQQAFNDFIAASTHSFVWQSDASRLQLAESSNVTVLNDQDPQVEAVDLLGKVNRQDAWLVVNALATIASNTPIATLVSHLQAFPGLSRRFEAIAPNLYSDYAHTPRKIEGALQLAHEVAGDNVVVVYEGLHNTRQHFIKDELAHIFDSVKQLYIVPSYLAREDPSLAMLSPTDLVALTSQPAKAQAAELDDHLQQTIQTHLATGDMVLCLTAGGGGSLDEWLRARFTQHS